MGAAAWLAQRARRLAIRQGLGRQTRHRTLSVDAATPLVQVVAAVITRDDGQFLLGRRPAGKVYAGYWEFPGGKVESGEALLDALTRELHEELGIEVTRAFPWLVQRFVYPHAHVQLNFFRVTAWSGEPHPKEAQTLAWTSAERVAVSPMLPANGPLLSALRLPTRIGITDALRYGVQNFLALLEAALERGLRMVIVREPSMHEGQLRAFLRETVHACHRHGAKVLLNGDPDLAADCDGIHLPARRLATLTVRPTSVLCGASCHDRAELERAAQLGLDFALLGSVLPTPTHPGEPGLGWGRVQELLVERTLPVYLIGGMCEAHMQCAWQQGAHGIAMIRDAWRAD